MDIRLTKEEIDVEDENKDATFQIFNRKDYYTVPVRIERIEDMQMMNSTTRSSDLKRMENR